MPSTQLKINPCENPSYTHTQTHTQSQVFLMGKVGGDKVHAFSEHVCETSCIYTLVPFTWERAQFFISFSKESMTPKKFTSFYSRLWLYFLWSHIYIKFIKFDWIL